MLRPTLIALLILASSPVLAFDLPLLTFPEAATATAPATVTSTSTANGK